MSAAVLSSEPAVSAAELLIVISISEIKTISHMIQFHNHCLTSNKQMVKYHSAVCVVCTVCIYIFQILRKVQSSTTPEA